VASGDAIHLRSAVALLGTFPALAGADLDVDRGEIVLVQGANGAGKTTLLRVCAGLLAVAQGEVVVLGHDLVRNRRAVRRHVGLLGPAGGLYDDLTVGENVRFAVRAAGGDASRVDAALERVGLTGRLARTPTARLSTGQRRRTALAVFVARNPALWLLDEPHAGLDSNGRELLDALIREAAGTGASIVLASHELDRATALAHRTVTMAGGAVAGASPAASGAVVAPGPAEAGNVAPPTPAREGARVA
jgi:heme ABC exporter ATP-binding subunit CcmA